MPTTKRSGASPSKPVEAATSPVRSVIVPSRSTLASYKTELRFLIMILAVLLIAAGQSLSIDRRTEPVFYGKPDLAAESSQRAQTVLPDAPLAAPVPAQVTVVTVPVQQAAPQQIIVREAPARQSAPPAAATTRPTTPRYENGGTPPVVNITRLGPQNQDAGRPVELTFRAGDADGVISGWIIDWGDGSTSADGYDDRCGPPPGEPDHDFPPVRHTYRDIGRYEVSIRVVSRGTCQAGPIQRADDRSAIEVGPAVISDLPLA